MLAHVWYPFVLIAAALAPPLNRLERRGWPLPRAVAVVALGVVAAVAIILAVANDILAYVDQAEGLLERLPGLHERVQDAAERGSSSGLSTDRILATGASVVGAVANAFFVLVLALYLLLDGERVYGWVARYRCPGSRSRCGPPSRSWTRS